MLHNFEYAERAKMLSLLRQTAGLRDIAYRMQEALRLIADGEGDAQVIAKQTLEQLSKEYGDGSIGPRKDEH